MPEVVVVPTTPVDTAKPVEGKIDATGALVVDSSQPAKVEETPLIGGKFKTQDDLLKAYTELEKKQGTAKTEGAPAAKPEATPEAAVKAVADAGLDLDALSREYLENDGLTAETVAALEAKGISKDLQNAIIAGRKAEADKITAAAFKAAGNEDTYRKMLEWAKVNAPDTQVAAFDDALHSGKTDLITLAVKGMLSDYSAAVGVDGTLIEGNGTPSVSGVAPFQSSAEVTAAMSDPRYKHGDAAYIKSVEQRLVKSKVFG